MSGWFNSIQQMPRCLSMDSVHWSENENDEFACFHGPYASLSVTCKGGEIRNTKTLNLSRNIVSFVVSFRRCFPFFTLRDQQKHLLQRNNVACTKSWGFLYLVFRRLNAGGKLVVGRSWTVKSRLHENENSKGEFCTSISLKIVKTSSSSMPSSDSITEVVARTFSVKTHKKDWMKNAELFVFNRSYNYISTKTTRKTKYQTSHGQNSYTSSFSFSEN